MAPALALSLWTPAVIQNSEHFSHKLSVRVMTVAGTLAICVAPKASMCFDLHLNYVALFIYNAHLSKMMSSH